MLVSSGGHILRKQKTVRTPNIIRLLMENSATPGKDADDSNRLQHELSTAAPRAQTMSDHLKMMVAESATDEQ